MVRIIIGNTKCKILGLTDQKVIRSLDREFSYQIPGYQFMRHNSGWDGRYRLLDKKLAFPVGLLKRAEKILSDHRIAYEIQDNREEIRYGQPLILDANSGFQPRDYQLKIVDEAWKNGSGIIKAATSSGKSLAIALMLGRFNVPSVIFVIGCELLYQMKDTLERAFPDEEIGLVGDGHCSIKKFTIATLWSAATAFGQKLDILENDTTQDSEKKNKNLDKDAIRKMIREAKLFCLDECQYASCSTAQLLHRELTSARHRFLTSASPWRDDNADILIEAMGGPKFIDISATELIQRGFIVPPKIYFLEVPPLKNVGKTYPEVYKNYIINNEERNELIVKAAEKLHREGRKTLILINRLEHGKVLYEMLEGKLRIDYLDGKDKVEDRLAVIQVMKNGELDLIIASKIFDAGIDLKELDSLILAGPSKSSVKSLQRIGRVVRLAPNKKDAIIVDFVDNCKFLKEHTKARIKIYSSEPGYKIILPKKGNG